MFRTILHWVGVGLAILFLAAYRWDMKRAFSRVRGRSVVIPSPYGDIEYSEGGAGLPVLVVHGSGGGFDQGELIAEVVLGDGYRSIHPSRFGYLRSTFCEGATFDDQAHAYAVLLDHLGIERAAVVAVSHGGPSALLFSVLHPERVTSLTLISTGVVTISSEDQGQAHQMGRSLVTVFKHNWLYWGLTHLFKKRFMGLMGANGAVIAGLTPGQLRLVERVIEEMNPVSLRSAGTAFDHQAEMPGERVSGIQAPTLVIHSTDDTLQLYLNAEFAAATIPDAMLLRFVRGGHLLFAVEKDKVQSAVQQHISKNFCGSHG